jgi:hypothetical protein
VQLLAELVRCLYWFNPLAWLACRQLRLEGEKACDNAVLSLGIPATTYASHLVDLARTFSEPPLPTAAMARPSTLERRILAMLAEHRHRLPMTRATRFASTSALLLLTVAVAGAGPSRQTASATVSGFVLDPSGSGMSGANVTASRLGPPLTGQAGAQVISVRFTDASVIEVLDYIGKLSGTSMSYDAAVKDRTISVALDRVRVPQAFAETAALGELWYRVSNDGGIFVFPDPTNTRYGASTDGAGYFELHGLSAGSYFLQVRRAGFASFQDNVSVDDGQLLQRNIALNIGTLEETITVRDGPSSDGRTPPAVRSPRVGPARPCVTSPSGGRITPPLKIRDVRPEYPPNLGPIDGDGRVLLEARIGIDGFVKDVRPAAPVDERIRDAAVAAVRQWQFTPTYLNCVPVEVTMTVTVNFVPQR